MRFTVVPFTLGLVLACIAPPAQSQVAIEQRATLDSSFASFLQCLETKEAACLISAISDRGIILGVDGPRVARRQLETELTSDPKVQCLFWGITCSRSLGTAKCSILSLAKRSPQYGKPYLYRKSWQAEVRTKGPSETCPPASFIFQLEKGLWKLVAIPYT